MKNEQFIPTHEGLETLTKQVREELGELMETRSPEGIADFKSRLTIFSRWLNTDEQTFLEVLDRALKETDHEKATQMLVEGLRPVIEYVNAHPEVLEAYRRQLMMAEGGNVQLSDIMYYRLNEEEGEISIHVMPAETLSMSEILKGFREGMKELARVVKQNPKITEVYATSWIVAKKPELMEKAGFTLGEMIERPNREDGEVEEEPSEGRREIRTATMTREKLLEIYGD